MSEPLDVVAHYTVGDLERALEAALRGAGKDPERLTVDDLAPVDAFHVRGRAATEELAGWARLAPGARVLDVGCGLGGTARFLASATGCHVTGVDLTGEAVRVAALLSLRVGLEHQTSFRQGSALALPFRDASFDVVWTEHAQMNIADKGAFYRELARVLRPGGQLAFHDVFAGPGGGLHLPVPWATTASLSHLAPAEEARAWLDRLGLEVQRWEDTSEAAALFFRGVLKRRRLQGPAHLGLHLLMGDDAEAKLVNMLRNLEDEHLVVVQALARKGLAG